MLFEKTRERLAEWRIRRDSALVAHGLELILRYEFTPLRCTECNAYGPTAWAVVARNEAGECVSLDWRCAREKGLRFLRLEDCVKLAAAAGMDVSPPKPQQHGYIDVGPTDNTALLYNAQTKSFTPSHTAMVGGGKATGAPLHFEE
ncbi:hypothetical protein [Streptomyces sp. NPDC006132]|uniref:hypothetical protein n=1 Tax=Streptomyces sp. NPDC006132 TaxID=3156732 RepID=UPI0033F48CEC